MNLINYIWTGIRSETFLCLLILCLIALLVILEEVSKIADLFRFFYAAMPDLLELKDLVIKYGWVK